MRSWNEWMTVTVALALGAAACGGATSSATGNSEASADGSSGAASSSSGATDGSASTDDGGGEDGSLLISGGSSGGSSSGSGSTDAMASSSGVAPGDGGPGQVMCGVMGPCSAPAEVCCATKNGRMCVATGSCAGDSLACSGSSSCTAGSGDVCCEALAANGTVRTRCETACPAGSLQLCTSKADCKADEDCRRGLDGYDRCVAGPREGGAGESDAAGD